MKRVSFVGSLLPAAFFFFLCLFVNEALSFLPKSLGVRGLRRRLGVRWKWGRGRI